MDIRYGIDPVRYGTMNSAELRDNFLIDDLFIAGKVTLTYSLVERAVVGSAVPEEKPLPLEATDELAAEYFAQRREIGVCNIGNDGVVTVEGKEYRLANRSILYIGRGSKDILFSSSNSENPAKFYMVSYPAHKSYPTVLSKKSDANVVRLGTTANANSRTIYQHIHENGIKSCQLVMGLTELEEGSVWNTMPPHTHLRRSEIYMYFGLGQENILFHLMGKPDEIRNIVVRDGQAVISPIWSFHAGVGTKNYGFIWSMGGENQTFEDMDLIDLQSLR